MVIIILHIFVTTDYVLSITYSSYYSSCRPRVSTNFFKSSPVLIGRFSFNITEWDL